VYTLDTNAIIYYVNDDPQAAPILQAIFDDQRIPIYASVLTEVELFSAPQMSTEEVARIESVLTTISRITLTTQIARVAGRIRSTYRLKLPDSVIAATAIFTGSTLLTRNVRDFKRVPNLIVQKI
jgi:predicted nucleic acid-binding protein